MQSTSFCGCCSSRAGTSVIAILHLIVAPLLWHYLDHPFYNIRQWTSFIILLMPLTVLLLIGVIKKNVDFVFPFVCMHFVCILMWICHICKLLIGSSFFRFTSRNDTLFLLSELVGIILMMYFFTVVFAFYQELLQERFLITMSRENSFNSKRAQVVNNILNNFDYQEPIKIKVDKEMSYKAEESKQSMA